MFGVPTREIRIVVQGLLFGLWAALIFFTHHPMDSWILKHVPASFFLRIDPLVFTVVCGGMRIGVTLLFLGAVTLAVSLLLGRVFCGWVCPLGTIFDGYGWILKRMRIRTQGPSPRWFRAKYYLLVAILIFAVLGGVSPLMGLDPIVLLTRTVAVVLSPFWRGHSELAFGSGTALGMHGYWVDGLTLLLFMTIMAGTTRLSRIWCRTACPLGAYLGVLSRHSMLRRSTSQCVRCNICSQNCPTGAISFENPEVYNESECIKCFSCSQECPVDANFFHLQSPLPAVRPSHHPVSLERRQLITTGAFAVLSAPVLQLSAGEPNSSKKLIRPPMSLEEHDFLSSCIRCGECMKACPTGILKPAGVEHGFRALWSPVMVASEGACLPGCNACSQACPTNAILKYPIEQKYAFKAGTAVFNSSLCISHTENKYCSECVKVCPTHAIEIQAGWKPASGTASDAVAPDGQLASRPIHVNFDRCVGCGACENSCNQIVFGEPAMVLTSFGRAAEARTTSEEKTK